ncbi:MAG: FHA domain-containing protein [Clostridium sp.]|nr:FHA domain-containing protein [Clostridium sp.]MCM1207470.1 FHA domain-containing protein [Ruminococcus sp.]
MKITVRDGDKPSYEVDLDRFGKDVISFGRQSDNDIVLQSPYASKIHGVLYAENGKYYVEDLDSTNGLCFYGKRFKKHMLKDGDVIVIQGSKNNNNNNVEIRFRLDRQDNMMLAYPQQTYLWQTYPQQMYPQQTYPQPMYLLGPQPKMGWFNFIIWVQLFFLAIVSLYIAVVYISAADFDTDGVKYVDDILGMKFSEFYSEMSFYMYLQGFVSILCAVLCIYVRMQMAAYKKNAFREYAVTIVLFNGLLLFKVCVIDVPLMLIDNNPFQFAANNFEYELSTEDYSYIVGAIMFVLIYLLANKQYFDKRKHLFVN